MIHLVYRCNKCVKREKQKKMNVNYEKDIEYNISPPCSTSKLQAQPIYKQHSDLLLTQIRRERPSILNSHNQRENNKLVKIGREFVTSSLWRK